MRWYHIETQDRDLRDRFLLGLRLAGIYYEVEPLPGGWRIALRADKHQRRTLDRWLARQQAET